ncbi:hypothetical protein [Leptospira noguchii]|nr:hypothetical protein [Leptospira noguchii]EKR71189.1 hypothetical protein LEP1GSC041_1796 [Leptospira noguchii str. 2006001870]EMO42191.1 hypothetical protein LEP1GSC186_0492 [Leptospira noguchii serovar Autumnalis str. ZUN142]EMS84004.1 hypothetical protein LEP1GSC074_3416 [Leptospira noguchii str. Hook]UOG43311.1 hypothetical protein MAL05_05015 [Leptospira noguchii]UOG50530.1 hypothetical protein MAL00_05360 [Leptospira noguchii]
MFNSEYKHKKIEESIQQAYHQNSDLNRNPIESENSEPKTKQIRVARPELYDK